MEFCSKKQPTSPISKFFLRSIPDGDVFLHTGDFTYKKSKDLNQMEQVIQFNDWLGTLPHKHKIVIAGNHEFSFDSRLA